MELLLDNLSFSMTNEPPEAHMDPKPNAAIDPSLIDHLLVDKDKTPKNEDLFSPDPDAIPFTSDAILEKEKEINHFISTPAKKETPEEKELENKHQKCYRLESNKLRNLIVPR